VSEHKTEFQTRHELADTLDLSARKVSNVGAQYETGWSAAKPIQRLEAPERTDQSQSRYLYRWDPDARWSSDEVRVLWDAGDWTYPDLAEHLPCSKQVLVQTANNGKCLAKRLHAPMDALAERLLDDLSVLRDADEGADWYAVCDEVCGRLVVSALKGDQSAAARYADQAYTDKTCDPVVVRGDGDPPETGLRLDQPDAVRLNV